jgi:hypothetical protein
MVKPAAIGLTGLALALQGNHRANAQSSKLQNSNNLMII